MCLDHLRRSPSLKKSSHHPPAPPSISRRWRASIVVLNRSEAASQDRVDSIRLAEGPVRPLFKSGCTGRIFERGLALPNGRDVRANFLRFLEGPCLGEEPGYARLFKSLE